ncbi:MAG: hypothetical protein OCD00_16485 [Colwellia sp.]
MNMSGLSFNALPPIDLPFRFFITAPLFVIACAFLVFFAGESLWLTRWHPSMLALTHGFTLGFITSIMMGALLQLLPVVGGIGIAKPRFIASTCHAFHLLGSVCLVVNFIWPNKYLSISALVLLAIGLGGYILALAWVLIKKLSQGDSIIGFRLAICAFLVVLLCGLILQSRYLGIYFSFMDVGKQLTNIHALWGLVGWGSLLIIAVSFQVIPMFHVAPSFPVNIRRILPALVFILLIVFVFFQSIVLPLIVFCHGIFALSLLFVIHQRKRKIPDNTIRFWQLSAVTLFVLNVFYFTPDSWINALFTDELSRVLLDKKSLLMAAVFIYVYLVSVIQGMLLKILPFLSYTHLQQRCLINFNAMQLIPHMHEFLNKKHGQWLFYLHSLSSIVLIITILTPSWYWLFSLLLWVEFTWLLILMVKTMWLYFSINNKINLLND